MDDAVKTILHTLYDDGYRFIVRDRSGQLYAFRFKPTKADYFWESPSCEFFAFYALGKLFPNIKWEDEEPFSIANHLGIIDWSSVPVDTKVLVRDDDNEPWEKAYFKEYRSDVSYGPFITFAGGTTSWSTYSLSGIGWTQCKLEGAE